MVLTGQSWSEWGALGVEFCEVRLIMASFLNDMGDFFLLVDVEDGVGGDFWPLMLQDWGLGRGAGGAEVVLGFLVFGNFSSSGVSIS